MTIKIAIADDMDLAREGMKTILRGRDDFQVVGTYHLLPDLLDALGKLRPDVILLGDRLEPEMDVLTLIERVKAAAPRARIIILSNLAEGLIVHDLLMRGVMGYLYKFDPLSLYLVEAIQNVIRGQPYLSPSSNSAYLLAMQTGEGDWQIDAEAREILRQIAEGHRLQEIAYIRHIPIRRVYCICERLRRRFGAETNMQLMALVAREGFVS
ncbi:MAG TPA: response regulator transcription factor [Bellilinea sp.]|nr:response regulator transcription factor [Bellilinea sp.]